jgi:hypothetical protein
MLKLFLDLNERVTQLSFALALPPFFASANTNKKLDGHLQQKSEKESQAPAPQKHG